MKRSGMPRRRAPLVSSATKASTNIARKRDALRRRGRGHQSRMEELRPAVLARAAWRCERCGAREGEGGRHLEVHHRLPLGAGGPDTLENLVALCDPGGCHDWVHANPAAGYASGLLLRRSAGPPSEPWSPTPS